MSNPKKVVVTQWAIAESMMFWSLRGSSHGPTARGTVERCDPGDFLLAQSLGGSIYNWLITWNYMYNYL